MRHDRDDCVSSVSQHFIQAQKQHCTNILHKHQRYACNCHSASITTNLYTLLPEAAPDPTVLPTLPRSLPTDVTLPLLLNPRCDCCSRVFEGDCLPLDDVFAEPYLLCPAALGEGSELDQA